MEPMSIVLAVLGIPVNWLQNYSYEILKKKLKKNQDLSFKPVFMNAFYRGLEDRGREYGGLVKKLVKAVKQDEDALMAVFAAHAGEYHTLAAALHDETFYIDVAADIVQRYDVEENFAETMELVVRESLGDYRARFLGLLEEKQLMQLLLLTQGATAEKLLAGMDELKYSLAEGVRKVLTAQQGPRALAPPEPEAPEGKQTKILSITAVPDQTDEIFYERGQEVLLEAFGEADPHCVFLDMPDPVDSTVKEISAYLEDGKHDVLHITAHGHIDDQTGEGYLCLEDAAGDLQKVTGSELFKALSPKPLIVILTSCHSARPESDLTPVAQALYDAGIHTVVGMSRAVTYEAAVEFNSEFFLTLCTGSNVQQAFEAGKQRVFEGEEWRVREIEGWTHLKEYEVPQMLTRDGALSGKDFSDYRIPLPGPPQSHVFEGAGYLERGFVGRRQILRQIYKAVEEKTGAVVLKGPGGIGKSTLTTRVAAGLRRKGYEFVVIQAETSIENIIEKVSKRAAASGVTDADKVAQADADPLQKLGWLMEHFFAKQPVLVIFDNFEENQDPEKGGDFINEPLKQFLWQFREWLKHKESVLMFSTRYALPGFPVIDVREFSDVEFRKKLRGGKTLKRMDVKDIKQLFNDVGGSPRGLELLETIAAQEFDTCWFSYGQLIELFPEMRERMLLKGSEEDPFAPMFLDRLLSYLTGPQKRVLEVLSVFRFPVPAAALEAMETALTRTDRRHLTALSLIEYLPQDTGPLFYVHRLTAQYLREEMAPEALKTLHTRAAEYFYNIRDEEGKIDVEDLIESRWHHIRVGQWGRAAKITADLESFLKLRGYTHRALELLLELDMTQLDEEDQAITHNRLGELYRHFGLYELSLEHNEKVLKIAKNRNNSINVAATLHQIGIIHHLQGRYKDALKQYEQSLEIERELDNPKGIAESLHEIGIIHQDQGRYEDALKQYEQSLEIKKKIDDTQGIARSLHQIGNIHQYQGRYEKALKQYEQSLEMKEEIGDLKGIASSIHQIGIIYEKQDRYDDALKQYEQSLEIFTKIGDINNAAMSKAQMGALLFEQERWEPALKHFIQALMIFAKIGSPYADKVRNLIAGVRENMPDAQFQAVIGAFGLPADAFDKE